MDNQNDQNQNKNNKGGNRQTIFILLAASLVMLPTSITMFTDAMIVKI